MSPGSSLPVIISQAAIDDLVAIGQSIASDNPARAESFVDELKRKCHGLGSTRLAWPLVPHRANHDIRRRVHGNYLIFYRIASDRVEVVRMLHGARDYAAWLFSE